MRNAVPAHPVPLAAVFVWLVAFLGPALAQDDAASNVDVQQGPDSASATAESEAAYQRTRVIDLRATAHRRFLLLIDEKRYEEAVPVAQRVVDLTRQEYPDEEMMLVAPLDNLATAQMMKGDLVAAENNYKASIAIIEKHQGILSLRLVNPLIGLGATYNRSALYEEGAESFERALRINHVNEGFYNFDQFKIRDGLTESQIGLQDLEEANFQQVIQVEISQRKLGMDSPEIIPAMYKLARWYERSGQVESARSIYQGARRILKEAYGKQDPALVDALVGISNTYERQGLMAEGASALKKAIDIIDGQLEPDYLRRAELLVALGDLYTSFGKPDSAQVRYVEAWQDLSRDDAFLDQRDEYFAEPVRIAGLPFSALEFASEKSREEMGVDALPNEGYVLVSYTVTNKGRVNTATVVESEPPGLMDKRVVSTLERSYYRPRFEDGTAIESTALLYRHDFYYFPTRTEEPDAEGEPLEYPTAATDDAEASGKPLTYPPEPADN